MMKIVDAESLADWDTAQSLIESQSSDLEALEYRLNVKTLELAVMREKCEGMEEALKAADELKEHAFTVCVDLTLGMLASKYSALRAAVW